MKKTSSLARRGISTFPVLAVIVFVLIVVGFATHAYLKRIPAGVILITIDTLRADRLSAYGYKNSQTANIDRLADAGVLFETVYADIPWTTGSMASVMTGMYGYRHGLQVPWVRLPDDRVTLAEILRDNGVTTKAIVGIFSLDETWNLDQGFEDYDDELSEPTLVIGTRKDGPVSNVELPSLDNTGDFQAVAREKQMNDAYRPDENLTDAALEWLQANSSKPFFLWLHYFGPHERLIFDGTVKNQRERILEEYDSDLANTDRAVGRLLEGIDNLGIGDSTMIVLHADHGQELGEHGIVGHGRDLYEHSVRIPLIIRFPNGIEPKQRVSTVVRNIDIAPTILDYLRIDRGRQMQGRSLANVRADDQASEEPAFMDLSFSTPSIVEIPEKGTFFAGTKTTAVRLGRWKYIRADLLPPCVKDATDYSYGITGVNPAKAIGGIEVPAEECAALTKEALYDVSSQSGTVAAESEDLAALYPEVVAKLRGLVEGIEKDRGEAEGFQMSEEEEAKLKSLGYLED